MDTFEQFFDAIAATGEAPEGARVPVYSASGRLLGSMPFGTTGSSVRSNHWLYDPRPGDLRLEGDRLVAASSLGPGDFECMAGFVSEWGE